MSGLSFFSNAEIQKYLSISATIAILSFFLILPITAQDESRSGPAEEDRALNEIGQSDFLTSGLYGGGLTFIDGDAYIQLQLQPDIPLGKVGIGLDLILLYNPYAEGTEPQLLAEDGESWDSPSTWLRLIRYVRYGRPYDPFYVRFGELDYLTIGHGSIMSGYSNYDRRGLRLNFRDSKNRSGVETMLNDIGSPSIFGGRAFLRPFQREENNNFLTRFEIGVTYLTDINPNLRAEGEEPLSAIGLDVGFPLFETSTFRLDLYDDIAFLNTLSDTTESESETRAVEGSGTTANLAWGNAVGIGFAFTQAIFKIEYRIFGDGYIPSVFDYTYESAKSLSPEPNMPQFLGVEAATEPRRGFYSQLIWQPLPQIHCLGTLEDYTNIEPKLYVGTTVSKLVPRLSLRAFYTKRDIGAGGETNFFGDLFDLDEKSAFSVEARYAVFPPVETIVLREYRFRRVETAAGVSQFEPIHKTSFIVGISTDF